MYEVKVYHHRPAYVKGDLEDETILVESNLFRTRTKAKAFIESKMRPSHKHEYRSYHRGDETSYCGYYTGKTWIHENTGETCSECYEFVMKKVVAK